MQTSLEPEFNDKVFSNLAYCTAVRYPHRTHVYLYGRKRCAVRYGICEARGTSAHACVHSLVRKLQTAPASSLWSQLCPSSALLVWHCSRLDSIPVHLVSSSKMGWSLLPAPNDRALPTASEKYNIVNGSVCCTIGYQFQLMTLLLIFYIVYISNLSVSIIMEAKFWLHYIVRWDTNHGCPLAGIISQN